MYFISKHSFCFFNKLATFSNRDQSLLLLQSFFILNNKVKLFTKIPLLAVDVVQITTIKPVLQTQTCIT